jgi:hypothetical protein
MLEDGFTKEALALIGEKLFISETDLETACKEWEITTKAIEEGWRAGHGQTSKDRTAIFERFLTLHRYCHDAGMLMERHLEQQSSDDAHKRKTLLVIDPHIFSAWSEYWVPTKHKGFDFVDQEHLDWDIERASRSFETFVYDSVFIEDAGCALLDAGRAEISEHVAYYAEKNVKRKDVDILVAARELAGELKGITESLSSAPSHNFVQTSFLKLMRFVSVPAIADNLALARLVRLMKRRNFYSTQAILRNAIRSTSPPTAGSDFAISTYDKFQRFLRTNSQSVARSRNSFIRAYEQFRLRTSYGDLRHGQPTSPDRLRGGEMHDLLAMHELHLLNVCLDAAGIDCEFAYVTLSTRMYNFVRGFDEAALRCRLLHPRTAHLINQDVALMEEFTNSAAALTPLLQNCKDDGLITSNELGDLEALIRPPLRSVRNACAFEVADEKGRREDIIAAIKHFADVKVSILDPSLAELIKSDLDDVEGLIKKSKALSISDYKEEAINIENSLWDEYEKLRQRVSEGAGESKEARVLIRRFETNGTRRFTCIPISGGYRHMFVLHNSFLDDTLCGIDQTACCFTMRELLDKVRNGAAAVAIGDSPILLKEKAKATEFFVKACFAAVDHDWMLAHTAAKLAHEVLEKGEFGRHHNEGRPIDTEDIARAYLLDQEILFLRHLCRRALAEASAPNRRLERWLALAAGDLNQCAHYARIIPAEYAPFDGETGPVSLRVTLAAIGLRIEWLYQERSMIEGYRGYSLGLKLPQTEDRTLAWHSYHERLSSDNINFSELESIASSVGQRCEAQLSLITQSPNNKHNLGFWKFLRLRAYAMELLTSALCNRFEANFDNSRHADQFDLEEIGHIKDLAWEYHTFVSDCSGEHREDRPHHFMECLIGCTEIAIKIGGGLYGNDLSRVEKDIDNIDLHCSELYRFGFPRSVIRTLKSELVQDFIRLVAAKYEIPAHMREGLMAN